MAGVRRLETKDVPLVWDTFSNQTEFGTGKLIRFYDEIELEYWSQDKQSLFLVAESPKPYKGFVGFAFVKYFSPSWAMLDGFYVVPAYRNYGFGKLLLAHVREEVKNHGNEYLCSLVPDEACQSWLEKHGFSKGKQFTWMEQWTGAPRTSLGRLGWDEIADRTEREYLKERRES